MIDEGSFCTLPFVHISNRPDGAYAACCMIFESIYGQDGSPLFIQDGVTFEEAFRSPYMDSLRKSHLEGKKDPRCNICWSLEDQGIISKRMHDGLRYLEKTVKRLEEPKLPFAPLSWDIKLGSLCNLNCRMCSPFSSSSIKSEHIN